MPLGTNRENINFTEGNYVKKCNLVFKILYQPASFNVICSAVIDSNEKLSTRPKKKIVNSLYERKVHGKNEHKTI